MQMSNQLSSDNVDYSNQNMTEFPTIAKQNIIIRINLRNNKILSLPNLSNFSVLRVLDLSHNRFVDLSPISSILSLRELDCSENSLVSLGFVASLSNLEILRASHNRISTVAVQMPNSLIDVDLSYNEIVSLDFLQHKFPSSIQRLDISANSIDEVISLRVMAVFPNLHTLNVGLLETNKDIQILSFVKFLCPSLVLFDGAECSDLNLDENFPNNEILLDVLVRGNENELRSLIQNVENRIIWDDPNFIPFDEVVPSSPLLVIERKLQQIEQKIPMLRKHAEQASPRLSQIQRTKLDQIGQDIGELKAQIAELTQTLYVHEMAMKSIIH
ncbi:hypothetical protein TRFO_26247 [Tritrichomonas foetus]|uniref:Leucine Rich Repeat family protein n=1 Tax=Tritrichomonas foetus TaxID=1144522 RepID=A0A1J4K4V1_9EUKA|nr:hypothetical protein TRFO_26247 [Tritrichomonas foetus]|eukprot:OHT05888.1 hypothetical protein TRFO_26247 [Tritrichomonas foetus]